MIRQNARTIATLSIALGLTGCGADAPGGGGNTCTDFDVSVDSTSPSGTVTAGQQADVIHFNVKGCTGFTLMNLFTWASGNSSPYLDGVPYQVIGLSDGMIYQNWQTANGAAHLGAADDTNYVALSTGSVYKLVLGLPAGLPSGTTMQWHPAGFHYKDTDGMTHDGSAPPTAVGNTLTIK